MDGIDGPKIERIKRRGGSGCQGRLCVWSTSLPHSGFEKRWTGYHFWTVLQKGDTRFKGIMPLSTILMWTLSKKKVNICLVRGTQKHNRKWTIRAGTTFVCTTYWSLTTWRNFTSTGIMWWTVAWNQNATKFSGQNQKTFAPWKQYVPLNIYRKVHG